MAKKPTIIEPIGEEGESFKSVTQAIIRTENLGKNTMTKEQKNIVLERLSSKIAISREFNFEYEAENHTFNNFRTFDIEDEPWFAVIDICRTLGIGNPSEAIKSLDEVDLSTTEVDIKRSDTGTLAKQTINITNESGLYQLIFQSRKPEAKRFKRWVSREVIPSIRKKGYFGTPKGTPAFVRRFNENWDRVDRGHFSVISETFIRMYGKFEQLGYKIPDKSKKNIEIRPDTSIGMGFANYMRNKYPDFDDSSGYSMYMHILPNKKKIEARQYKNLYLADFIEYVESEWLFKNAPRYLEDRAPESLPYLEKILRALPSPKKNLTQK